jgi:hypothetical protein
MDYSLIEDFTPAQIERARRRCRDIRSLRLAATVSTPLALCVLGFSPLGAGLVRTAGRIGDGWVATAAFGAVLGLLGTVPLNAVIRRVGATGRALVCEPPADPGADRGHPRLGRLARDPLRAARAPGSADARPARHRKRIAR